MAKGRFVSREITLDKRVNDLSDDTSRLGFTWLIPHLDCEGRTYGDSAIVKSLIFPRRCDVTPDMVEQYILEWCSAGLCVRYEADGDLYIEFPNFDKHQVGLRKDREPSSVIPELTDDCRIVAGSYPAEVKLSKVNNKLSEGHQQNFFSKFQSILGPLGGNKQVDTLKDLLKELGEQKILEMAQWLADKGETSMYKALRTIQVKGPSWVSGGPVKHQNDGLAWLESELAKSEEVTNG